MALYSIKVTLNAMSVLYFLDTICITLKNQPMKLQIITKQYTLKNIQDILRLIHHNIFYYKQFHSVVNCIRYIGKARKKYNISFMNARHIKYYTIS